MKRTILTLVIALVGALVTAILPRVFAQAGPALVATIPFSFSVCREQLPAGKYTIQHLMSSSSHKLIVRGEDGRPVDIACTVGIDSRKAITAGRLVFNRYNDQYFLAEAWWPGDQIGHEVLKSERETALMKELSGGEPKRAKKPEKVIIKIAKPGE